MSEESKRAMPRWAVEAGMQPSDFVDYVAANRRVMAAFAESTRARIARDELVERLGLRTHGAERHARDAKPRQAPEVADSDWPEPLSEEEAQRIFMGTALRFDPALDEAVASRRAEMAAASSTEAEILEATLAMARERMDAGQSKETSIEEAIARISGDERE